MDFISKATGILTTADALKTVALDIVAVCDGLTSGGERLRNLEGVVAFLAYLQGAGTSDAQHSHAVACIQESIVVVQALQQQAGVLAGSITQQLGALKELNLSVALVTARTQCNKWHNSSHSPVLQLPNTVLGCIARQAGKDARVVCRQLYDAYGCPGSGLRWPSQYPMGLTSRMVNHETIQPAFLEVLTTWQWPYQLTNLVLDVKQPLHHGVLTAIATRCPNLALLSCPWLEYPFPAVQQPPALAALTALRLNYMQPFCTLAPRHMQAFGQLVQLTPRLNSLSLDLSRVPSSSQPFVPAMQQLAGRLTSLHLHGDVSERRAYAGLSGDSRQHILDGVRAVAGSLQRLEVARPEAFGPGVLTTLRLLTQLTCLVVYGQCKRSPFETLPLCRELPSLQQLNLSRARFDNLHHSAGLVEPWGFADDDDDRSDDDVPGWQQAHLGWLDAWLKAGQSEDGGSLRELQLPTKRPPLLSQDVRMADAVLVACSVYTGLTSLHIDVTSDVQHRPVAARGWPAAVARLANLQLLDVAMNVSELNSTSSWGTLGALTHLRLSLHFSSGMRGSQVDGVVSAAALQDGLGRMLLLQHVKLGLWQSSEELSDWALLRGMLLKALAALPQLELLDVLWAVRNRHNCPDVDPLPVEELAAGPAGRSLKTLVLDKVYADHAAVIRQALPAVVLQFEKGPCSFTC